MTPPASPWGTWHKRFAAVRKKIYPAQDTFAARISTDRRTVSRWETAQNKPSGRYRDRMIELHEDFRPLMEELDAFAEEEKEIRKNLAREVLELQHRVSTLEQRSRGEDEHLDSALAEEAAAEGDRLDAAPADAEIEREHAQ